MKKVDLREQAIEAFTRFLASPRSKLAPVSRRKYAAFVHLFLSFLRHSQIPLESVTKEHLETFQKSLCRKAKSKESWRADVPNGYSAATRNLMASSLSSFFKLCNREGLTDFYPELARVKLEPPEIKHLYAKEVAYFREYLSARAACEDNPHKRLMLLRLNAAIFGYLGSGARVSELLSIRWADVRKNQTEAGKRFWTILLEGKGNKRRRVTLSPSAVRGFNEYRKFQADYFWRRWRIRVASDDYVFLRNPDQVMTDRGIRKAINQVYRQAKSEAAKDAIKFHLKSIHPHLFRHTVGTQLRTAGADLATIQTQLGHSSSDTTSKYYVHRSLESVADAVSRMDRNLFKMR